MTVYAAMVVTMLVTWAIVSKLFGERAAVGACFFIMFLVMGLRASTVGTDTSMYQALFVATGKATTIAGMLGYVESAPLYDAYSWLLYRVFPFRQAILVFNSAIICTGFACFISRFARRRLLATLLFVGSYMFFDCMNAMRQSVAISFLLLACVAFSHRKRLLAALLALCAVLVHNTAVILVVELPVAYALASRHVRVRTVVTAMAAAVVVASLAFEPAVEFFVRLFPRYSMYVNGEAVSAFASNGGRTRFLYAGYVVLVLSSLASRRVRNVLAASPYDHLLFTNALAAAALGAILSGYVLFARVLFYLLPFLVVYVANAYGEVDREHRTFLFRYLVLGLYTVLCLMYLTGNYGEAQPYQFFF